MVCNHTRDLQVGLPLHGRPILFITRMITDRIGLHSVLLPLFIIWEGTEKMKSEKVEKSRGRL